MGPNRTLILMRHAKSSWRTRRADIDRPLNSRGRRNAGQAGEWLHEHRYAPELVLCSPSTRTRETLRLTTEHGLSCGEVRYDDRIYDATDRELLALVRALPDSVTTAMLVGHATGIPDLLDLIAAPEVNTDLWDRIEITFPTATIAVVGVDGPWGKVSDRREARLLDLEIPRD